MYRYCVTLRIGFTFITGNKGRLLFDYDPKIIQVTIIRHHTGSNLINRIINYVITQVKISCVILRLFKKVDIWILFIGGQGLILPVLVAKVMGKKVVMSLVGSDLKVAQQNQDPLRGMLAVLGRINYHLTNRIILYSPRLTKEYGLEKYKSKILLAHEQFINFDEFKIGKPLFDRKYVGYIGRLSEEKGAINFVQGISETLKKNYDVDFLIGGDGPLRGDIEKYLNEYNLNGKIKLTGWISHNNLSLYLNELKLIVLPSYTEGLPNIMLEAMACGTPVLATPVGAIPDYILDGETGFIMENNYPECVALNIIRALNCSNLRQIANNGLALVEKEFTFGKAVEVYREGLKTLSKRKN